MTYTGVMSAVFFANILTAAFIWGLSRASRVKESEIPALVYAALIVPLIVFILCLIGAGVLPAPLAALASR